MASIRVTPETLNSQGNELISYAGELSDILTKIHSKIEEIIGGWDGLGQDAYFEMYTAMNESLTQFPTLVDSLGQATVSAADAYATVDETLQTNFKNAL